MLQQIWSRLLDIAKGAALMTGTTYEVTGSSGDANIVSNDALGAIVQKNLEEVGGYSMSETERKFASDLQKTLNIDSPPSLDQTHEVEPLRRPDPKCACGVHGCGRRELGAGADAIVTSLRRPSCRAWLLIHGRLPQAQA